MLSWSLLMLACPGDSADEGPTPAPYGACDPLVEAVCALPYPSSFYEAEDATTVTGLRVDLRPTSLPVNLDGVQLDPTTWNEKDGWSTLGPALAWFDALDAGNLPGHEGLATQASLAADSPLVVVDLDSGERVEAWAELDMTAKYDDERLLVIYFTRPLRNGGHYAIGLRDLVTTAGAPVAVTPAFEALRDGTPHESWDVEGRRELFDTVVFPALEAQGVARAELQLAWDFHTMSRDSSLGRALWMRDDAVERMAPDGPTYTVTSTEEADCAAGASIGLTLYATLQAPLYTEEDGPGTLLTRDADGMPYYNGEAQVPFMVRVPCTLFTDPRPAPVVQYGHGLLGSHTEARTGYLSDMANRYGWIVVATDWAGMSDADYGDVVLMIANDPSDFAIIPERSMQGLVQQVALGELVAGRLAMEPLLTVEGTPLVDGSRYYYYGNSQGGIMGGALMGISPRLERGVLGVPGAPYSLLLPRSADFDPFFLIFKQKFQDHREIFLQITLMEMLWEPAEAGGWLTALADDPIPGDPAKSVLLQAAIGDAQVTTLGAQFMARALGASTVAPQTRPVPGVPEATPGFQGNALVEWAYPDGAAEPVENLPPDKELDTHECPRRELRAQDQLRDFLETGVVNQYCEEGCTGVRKGFCD